MESPFTGFFVDKSNFLSDYFTNRFQNTFWLEWLYNEIFRTSLDRIDNHSLLPHGRAHNAYGIRVGFFDFF